MSQVFVLEYAEASDVWQDAEISSLDDVVASSSLSDHFHRNDDATHVGGCKCLVGR